MNGNNGPHSIYPVHGNWAVTGSDDKIIYSTAITHAADLPVPSTHKSPRSRDKSPSEQEGTCLLAHHCSHSPSQPPLNDSTIYGRGHDIVLVNLPICVYKHLTAFLHFQIRAVVTFETPLQPCDLQRLGTCNSGRRVTIPERSSPVHFSETLEYFTM